MSRSKRIISCSLPMFLCALSMGSSAAQSSELGSFDEREIAASNIYSTAAACVLGNTTGLGNVQGMMNPGDAHYLLIDPSNCPTCSGRIVLRNYVLKLSSDSQQEGCSFTLRASVIGAGGTPSCRTPNPEVELCAPQTATFTPPFVNDYFNAVIPAPQNCCINGPAFLRIEVLAADECTRLGVTAAGGCQPCQVYWFQSSSGNLFDTCTFGFTHGFYVEADCCEAVPVDARAWGTIKTLYR